MSIEKKTDEIKHKDFCADDLNINQLETEKKDSAKSSLKEKYIPKLNEAIANIAPAKIDFMKTAQQEAMEKLEPEYKHGMKPHRKRIERIMFQDIRAFAKVYSEAMMFIKREVLILMVGLEADENTTIPYKLKLREYVTTIPTVGFNVETVKYENIDVTVQDVVGQDQRRLPWRHYYQNAQGFIFVICTNDRDRIEGKHEDIRLEDGRVG